VALNRLLENTLQQRQGGVEIFFAFFDSLSLDSRSDGGAAFAIHAHIDAQSNRGITAKYWVREPLLAIAVVQA
jgi:hypothetical protein